MPHSWELLKQKQDSVLIATPIAPPGLVSYEWAMSFSVLQKPTQWDTIRLSGLPWGEARTQAAYECLNRGHQFLFFIDSDVIVPADALIRLLEHRLPVVSGLYHQRFPTWTGSEVRYLPCMFNEGRDAQGNPVRVEITDFRPGQLVEAHYAPGGCLLIHRSVFERFLASGVKRIFEWTMNADNPRGTSEDFGFTHKCWELGFRVYVDTSIIAIHEVSARVDAKGLAAKL